MSFSKTTHFLLMGKTPANLATALAFGMAASNGDGHGFAVLDLRYDLPDGVGFKADSPTLADLQAMPVFPSGLWILVGVPAGDARVDTVSADVDRDRLRVRVSARSADGLATFFSVFSKTLAAEETTSLADEIGTQLRDGGGQRELARLRAGPAPDRAAPRRPGSRVLLFTALQEEREVLENELGLSTAFEDRVARGTRYGIDLELISGKRMGRVPAAVAVAAHLAQSTHPYRLILVAGIAGGFGEAQVEPGAVVVATEIVDLATRKMHAADTEFRPTVYATDDTVERFLNSNAFKRAEWQQAVLGAHRWPQGRMPYLSFGPLASVDEVVGSDEWRGELMDAWPKLLGVEMEAGGACAAADRFGHKIAVVRGISDKADPRKTDDQWRQIAMTGVVRIIDAMLSSGVLKASAM